MINIGILYFSHLWLSSRIALGSFGVQAHIGSFAANAQCFSVADCFFSLYGGYFNFLISLNILGYSSDQSLNFCSFVYHQRFPSHFKQSFISLQIFVILVGQVLILLAKCYSVKVEFHVIFGIKSWLCKACVFSILYIILFENSRQIIEFLRIIFAIFIEYSLGSW